MRKAILWLLIALMALQGLALAEPAVDAADPTATAAAAVEAVNGLDAARTASEIYLVLPSGEGEMLVRLPLDGSQPVCMDRADSIDGLINYGAGAAYLKTTDGASAIISCVGAQQSTLYSFGMSTAEHMTMFGGKLLVLMNGLLHSIEPDTGVCLKLSGAQMLDYVLGDGYAYYLAGGDMMEYTANLGDDETATAQAGCIYRLNLNNGETDLLLKSGGEDLKILDNLVYFHNLADAYAVRTGETAQLRGRVYSLDTQLKTLNSACAEPDSGFWPTRAGVVAWYNSALNLGETSLYAPENGSSVTFDGEALYVWEPTKLTLTEVRTDGSQTVLYSGDLTQAISAALLPEATATPEPSATPETDEATQANSDWFTNFMNNAELAGTSTGSTVPKATPIGATPTPAPTATAVPVSTAGTGSTGTAGSTGSTGSSSKTTYSTYSTSIKSLRITSAVNLRAKPLTSSTIYTSIPAGKIVSCTGTAAKTSGGSVWYQVKYNGTTGWIYSAYAEKYSESSSGSSDSQSDSTVVKTYDIDGKYVKVVGGSVNIRSKAGTSYKVVGSMPSGAYGTCLGTAAKDTRGVVWYKVKYNGVTGWVSSRYSKVTDSKDSSSSGGSKDSVKVVGGDVTIRAKANKTSAKLGYISEGKVATYLGKTSTDSRGVQWYYISYNGTKGWISSMYSRLM